MATGRYQTSLNFKCHVIHSSAMLLLFFLLLVPRMNERHETRNSTSTLGLCSYMLLYAACTVNLNVVQMYSIRKVPQF
jgi:hypothetical protein